MELRGALRRLAGFGLLVVLVLLDLGLSRQTGIGTVTTAVGIAIALGALVQARRHLVSAVAGTAIAAVAVPALGAPFSLTIAGILAGLMAAAVRRQPARLGAVLALGGALALGLAGQMGFGLALALAGVLLATVAVAVGVYLRGRDGRRHQMTEAVRRDERLALARDLHDVVGHRLTGIVVQAQAARHVAGSRPEAAAEALARIEREGGDALVAMRRMVGALRDDAPTTPAANWANLDALVRRSATGGLPVRLQLGAGVERVPADVVPSISRIVTEALTNAQRHALGATEVLVDVKASGSNVLVTVSDDGRSLTPSPAPGHGLVGMRERVEALGGTFSAGSDPSGGWRVRVALPSGRS